MCETILKGNLAARYYYVYAVDYDHGGEWMGQAYLCTRDHAFTIRGANDCLARAPGLWYQYLDGFDAIPF
jgi:uncharacterized membrane protein